MFEYLVVIYIVHDANIQLYFYIASDILKKNEKGSLNFGLNEGAVGLDVHG